MSILLLGSLSEIFQRVAVAAAARGGDSAPQSAIAECRPTATVGTLRINGTTQIIDPALTRAVSPVAG